MTELSTVAPADPITQPFWDATARRELVLQHCRACGAWQFYPRPFCLRCQGDELEWAPAAGTGTIYSMTTVHIEVSPELEPPYIVAVVELDEGPRLLATVVVPECAIGDRVSLAWRERADGSLLPMFEAPGGSASGQA